MQAIRFFLSNLISFIANNVLQNAILPNFSLYFSINKKHSLVRIILYSFSFVKDFIKLLILSFISILQSNEAIFNKIF